MIKIESLRRLSKAIQVAASVISEIREETTSEPQDVIELHDEVNSVEMWLKHLSTTFKALRHNVEFQGALNYHLGIRYYVYITEQYAKPRALNLNSFETAEGPWHDLDYAVKTWRRKMTRGASPKIAPAKIGNPIKYGIMAYNPKSGNLLEVTSEEIKAVESRLNRTEQKT